MAQDHVPRFYLYGEPPRSVDHGFVHVESLDHRNRPNEWEIRPHVHADLAHIFVVERGGGSMIAEDHTIRCDSPALILVPSGVIHGFAWDHAVAGSVLTLSSDYLAELHRADPGLRRLFAAPRTVPLAPDDMDGATAGIQRLMRELSWTTVGYRAAVRGLVLAIAVIALRGLEHDPGVAQDGGAQARLVARLRERIEARFRDREPAAAYAAALDVSLTTLRSACARITGTSPMALLDQRTLLEAKRSLIYSGNGVAEIGYALGFGDPAYFSRFFTRATGVSPSAFRASRGAIGATPR